MSFKIVREEDPMEIGSLTAVIFGLPGMGKSTLAQTSEKPVLEDFDDGIKRAAIRKDYLQISSWKEVVDFHNSDFIEVNEVKTFIIDTAGTMLDNFIAQHVIKENAKNGKSGGGLSLQGYGALKVYFNSFLAKLKSKGVDIIFIAHTETFQDGDDTRHRPKLTGGSYDVLMAAADLVGFMETKNNKRTLNFNPTDQHVGKNSAEFEIINIPHYTDDSFKTLMGDLLQKAKDRMLQMSESQMEAIKKLDEFKEKIHSCDDTEQLDEVGQEIKNLKSDLYRGQLFKVMDQKLIDLYLDKLSDLDSLDDLIGFGKEVSELISRDAKNGIFKIYDDKINSILTAKLEKNKSAQKLTDITIMLRDLPEHLRKSNSIRALVSDNQKKNGFVWDQKEQKYISNKKEEEKSEPVSEEKKENSELFNDGNEK